MTSFVRADEIADAISRWEEVRSATTKLKVIHAMRPAPEADAEGATPKLSPAPDRAAMQEMEVDRLSEESDDGGDSLHLERQKQSCAQTPRSFRRSTVAISSNWSPAAEGESVAGSSETPALRHRPRLWRRSLLECAETGDLENLRICLHIHGDDPNQCGPARRTALHRAAERGHADCVRELLSAGASVDALTSHGLSAAWLAAARGHPQVLAVLVGSGATTSLATPIGWTARDAAGYQACLHSRKLLARPEHRFDVTKRLIASWDAKS
jgi:hypothetical protein